MYKTVLIVLSLGLIGPLAGCGDGRPDLLETTGTVTLNGEPLADALVYFQPEEGNPIMRPSRAKTDAQGKFTLGTYGKKDGIPPGKYKVGIEKKELVGELPENFNSEDPDATPLTYRWITPRKLANPQISGLSAEVTENGLEPAVFELNRPGEPEIRTTGRQLGGNEP